MWSDTVQTITNVDRISKVFFFVKVRLTLRLQIECDEEIDIWKIHLNNPKNTTIISDDSTKERISFISEIESSCVSQSGRNILLPQPLEW